MGKPGLLKDKSEEIAGMYKQGIKMQYIANAFDVNIMAIQYQLRKMGLKSLAKSYRAPHRKYSLNQNFFDKIDSENKAYFLGFLYADGYNNPINGNVCIRLQVGDREILEKFKIIIESDSTIKTYMNGDYSYVGLYIRNSYISNRLVELGCGPNKSLKLTFPSFLEEDLVPHFLRGYFDGDGSFWTDKATGKAHVSLMGTRKFLEHVRDNILRPMGILKIGNGIRIPTKYKGQDESVCELFFAGNRQVPIFMDYIYENANIFLDRKFQKFLDYVV